MSSFEAESPYHVEGELSTYAKIALEFSVARIIGKSILPIYCGFSDADDFLEELNKRTKNKDKDNDNVK